MTDEEAAEIEENKDAYIKRLEGRIKRLESNKPLREEYEIKYSDPELHAMYVLWECLNKHVLNIRDDGAAAKRVTWWINEKVKEMCDSDE